MIEWIRAQRLMIQTAPPGCYGPDALTVFSESTTENGLDILRDVATIAREGEKWGVYDGRVPSEPSYFTAWKEAAEAVVKIVQDKRRRRLAQHR